MEPNEPTAVDPAVTQPIDITSLIEKPLPAGADDSRAVPPLHEQR